MSSTVLSSKDILKGKTGKNKIASAFVQPLQFIPKDQKTEYWTEINADYWEWQGLKQIFRKAPHLSKNYNLSNGIIDRSDYIPNEAPENQDILESVLGPQEELSLELRFYPIIPSFINTVCTEFSKRNTKMVFEAVDERSSNELLQMKTDEVTKVLLSDAERKMTAKLIEAGKDPNNPEDQQLFEEQLSPENLKTLPEIQDYFNKSYRSMLEEWASHQHKTDVYRFAMDELEERNFRNSLVTDQEYWHFRMMADDYDVEIWNPMYTYVFKSPEARYTSSSYGVGNVQLLTLPDVMDKFGDIMSEEQQKSLEAIYPSNDVAYAITGYSPESYYDNTIPHKENVEGPSLAMRQLTSVLETNGTDMLSRLMNQSQYLEDGQTYLLRVTTGYWKSQRRVGHLTKVKQNGEIITKVVDESYEVTDHPIYNNVLFDNRNTDTLVFGEHIDWVWIPQTYGFVKVGPNIPTYSGMPQVSAGTGLKPIYLGINQNKIGPLKYQFKGESTLYGCKVPVEGATFSDYNSRSVCPVDLLKPYQIGYNVVNNQINDILMDEVGPVAVIDQNQLPQTSLGEDWGKHNYSKAYMAMRSFGILGLDKSLQNTENGASSNAPAQMMDLSQTQRLQSRIQLANYFKQEGLSLYGVTPQRLGQPVGRQTATGVEENMNAAYNQTEHLFIRHSDWLMPRVHQMRTDLAQYYQSTKPSVRLQYMTSKEERVNFQINGTDLLLRDFNIYPVSTAKNRSVIEQLQKLLITNNTAGASIYELGGLMTSESLGEMNTIFKRLETRAEEERRRTYESEMAAEQQRNETILKEKQMQLDYEKQRDELDRQRDILVAEIRAAGYSGSVDLDQNAQNDFIDNLDRVQKQNEFTELTNIEREKMSSKTAADREKSLREREKINAQLQAKRIDLDIARVNTNQYDLKKKQEDKEKKKEKKRK